MPGYPKKSDVKMFGVSTYLPEDEYRVFKKLSEQHFRSMSATLRLAVRDYFKKTGALND